MNKELKKLLDSLTYYKDKDGKEYTPKAMFIAMYDLMQHDSGKYFADLLSMVDDEAVEDELKIFNAAGGGHDGAMAIIRNNIDLVAGGTLEYKTA